MLCCIHGSVTSQVPQEVSSVTGLVENLRDELTARDDQLSQKVPPSCSVCVCMLLTIMHVHDVSMYVLCPNKCDAYYTQSHSIMKLNK